MGQLLSSPQEQPCQESVINLSDSLLYRITDDEDEDQEYRVENLEEVNLGPPPQKGHHPVIHPPLTEADGPGHHPHHRRHINILEEVPHDVKERQHIQEQKAKDDVHSLSYGITVKNFDELLKKVSDLVEPVEIICPLHEMLHCLHHNKHCMTHCRPSMDHFIECVDTYRINVIKDLIECEIEESKKKKKKTEEDEIMGFLSEIELEEED